MLQITDRNIQVPNKTLQDIASEHYKYLNPKTIKGKYKSTSIINKIKRAISNHAGIEKRYFQFLLGRSNSRLKKILSGMPDSLDKIVFDYEHKYKFPSNFFAKINPSTNKLEDSQKKYLIIQHSDSLNSVQIILK